MDQSVREFVPALPDERDRNDGELLPVDDPHFLTNRELSWLEFNQGPPTSSGRFGPVA